MAKVYVAGPTHIYVQDSTRSNFIYLGTGEYGPDIELNVSYDQVLNDITGPVLPFDYLYAGELGRVNVTLTRYNESALASIQARPRGAVRGKATSTDIGTLMLTELGGYEMVLTFPKSALAIFADMPQCYHFLCSFLWGPDRIGTGTRAKKVGLTWYCLRKFTPPVGDLLLYDTTLPAGLPAID